VVTRWEPSVLRAGVMAGLVLFGVASGRGPGGRRALCLAVVVLLLADPSLAGALGFQLSVAATAGVLWLGPPTARALPARVPERVRMAVGTTLGAQATAVPALALALGPVSAAGLPANLLGLPLAEPLEAYVRDAVIAALDSPELQAALEAATEESADDAVNGLLEGLRAIETQLEDLGRDYADGLVAREAFLAAQGRLSDRLEATRRQLSRAAPRPAVITIPEGGAVAIRAEWDAWGSDESEAARLAGLERRRALLGLVLDRVVLYPCVRGRRDFDPTRVELVWRA
jgi:ComEC/Rec2-related protein